MMATSQEGRYMLANFQPFTAQSIYHTAEKHKIPFISFMFPNEG